MSQGSGKQDISETLNELLVSVAKVRDREAFRVLFEHFSPRIKSFALGQNTAPGLAEEIAQETMVNVWRKAGQFDPRKASAATWVFTIARNMRIDMMRKFSRPEPDMNDPALVPDADPPAHEQIARNQQADRLRKSLSGLPAEQQEVLHLVFMKEKTHVEAAEELEIPLGTVKSRVRLALKRVRSEIGERG